MASIPADDVVVPIGSEDDARETAAAVAEHLPDDAHVRFVYVVEKAGGAPDKAGVEQREEYAADLFELARARLADSDRRVDTRVLYGTDVAETVFDAAEEADADLVAFTPRTSSRLVQLLTGDTTLDLVTDLDRPVLVLPAAERDVAETADASDGGDGA